MLIKEIKKYKNYSKVKYNDLEYDIENNVMIKYEISVGREYNLKLFNEILSENQYYYYNRLALTKLKRMLTTAELETFLVEKGANKLLIDKLIEKYIQNNYLNDEYYIKFYLETKSNREGPKLILKKLIEKGLDKDLINKQLNELDQIANIKSYIIKRIPKIKNKTKLQATIQLKKELITKGFSYNLSQELVDKIINNYEFDETDLINKEFNKVYLRQNKRKSGFELKQHIKQTLYQKGFSKSLIEEAIIKNQKLFK